MNSARQAKRRKSYAQKLAAYRRSETFKTVEARAGGRCEHVTEMPQRVTPFTGPLPGAITTVVAFRCFASSAMGPLHHHHKTYARFGGKELPEDIQVLCERHHAEVESQHPTRKHRRRSAA